MTTNPGPLLALSARIRVGDAAAESELVREFQVRVLMMAAVRTGDREAARDLAQETLLAVVCALREGKLRDDEKLAAFVHGTARNVINNYLRSKAQGPREIPLDCEIGTTADNDLETAQRLALVRSAIERLSASEKRVLLLTLVEGLKPMQIAERLNLSAEVVRTQKSRALRKVTEHVRNVVTKSQPLPLGR